MSGLEALGLLSHAGLGDRLMQEAGKTPRRRGARITTRMC